MNDIIWMVGGLTAVFTALGGLMSLSSDYDTKTAGMKLLMGWWGGMITVIGVAVTMTFVIKPILAWGFNLIFF